MQTNRRTFVKQAACLSLVPSALARYAQTLNMDISSKYLSTIGIQLWTVRDQLAASPQKTLSKIAELGYQQVELMNVMQQRVLAPIVKDLGMSINSSFFDLSYVIGGWEYAGAEAPKKATLETVIDHAKKIGISKLVFGYLYPQQRETLDQYKSIIDPLNKAGELCRAAGIQLCYHNHNFEFKPLDGGVPYDVLIERLDPELVKFELDVFWADIAGWDPVKLMKRLKGRLELIHLKDKLENTPVIYENDQVPEEAFQALGAGTVKLMKVLKLAEKYDVSYCFVEQDFSPDPLKSIEESIGFLKNS